jgi:ligand-binding sensor domain-containing protein
MALSGDSLWIATVAGLRHHHIPDGAVESVDNSTVGLETLIQLHDTTNLGYIQKIGPTVCASGRNVWFWPGGSNEGLYLFDEKMQLWKRMLSDIQPRCLACRDNETLWVGTPGGLLRLDGVTGRKRLFTTLEGLLSDSVESLVLDSHSIWVGMSSGITRLDRAVFEKR